MLYLGKNYTQSALCSAVVPFWCRRCGHRASCDVTGVGTGRGHSPFVLDNEGAAERAQRRAEHDALDNLQIKVSLARCPACGRRDRASVVSHWVGGVIKAGGALSLFGGLAALFAADSPVLAGVLALIGVVTVCVLFGQCATTLRQADAHLEFVPGPPPCADPPPPRRRIRRTPRRSSARARRVGWAPRRGGAG